MAQMHRQKAVKPSAGPPPARYPQYPAFKNRMGPLSSLCMVCHLEINQYQYILQHAAPNCGGGIHTRCMKIHQSVCPGCKQNIGVDSRHSIGQSQNTMFTQGSMPSDRWHTTRERQKRYHNRQTFYQIPGYRAQDNYTLAIRAAGQKRANAEANQKSAAQKLMHWSERATQQQLAEADQNYRLAINRNSVTLHNTRIQLQEEIRYLECRAWNHRCLAHEIEQTHLRLQQIEHEASTFEANARLERDTTSVAIRSAANHDLQRMRIGQTAEHREICDVWRRELEQARARLLNAHKADRAFSNLWELHPPDPLMNQAAVEGNARAVYYD